VSVRRAAVDVDAMPDEAFGLAEDHPPFSAAPHTHAKHQILYASKGTMTLSACGRRWMLPPQRAAFLPAGTTHAAASTTGIELRTIYLTPKLLPSPAPNPSVRVFAVTTLAREMILHAMRWGPATTTSATSPTSATRAAFFRALAGLSLEWMADERPYHLPEPTSPELSRATAWIAEHLAGATVETAAAAAHVSVRTLARRFEEEAGMPFRTYLQTARMLRAMELLAKPRASVSATAYAVGFQSIGAFTTAFHERCGETPSEYRARVRG
jgi:AraC-like DNA-binding protein